MSYVEILKKELSNCDSPEESTDVILCMISSIMEVCDKQKECISMQGLALTAVSDSVLKLKKELDNIKAKMN